jgi:hypothetical protein
MGNEFEPHEGGCSCGFVRYKVMSDPLIVHACHCSWCQTQSGAAFAINTLIEADRVQLLNGEVEVYDTPSPAGYGQMIHRCPKCKVALWSNYNMFAPGDRVRFIRAGTLDDPNLTPPDVHIYTTTKQNWMILPKGDQVEDEFYDTEATWSPEVMARVLAARDAPDT